MKVKVYSTTWCPYCKMVKDFLKENKIPFEDINIEKEPKKAEEMIKKSNQNGVPVIDVNGQIVIGFDREKIKKLLKLK